MMQEAYICLAAANGRQEVTSAYMLFLVLSDSCRWQNAFSHLKQISSSPSLLSRRPLQTLRIDIMTTCGHHVEINALRGERCTGEEIVTSINVSDAHIAKSLHPLPDVRWSGLSAVPKRRKLQHLHQHLGRRSAVPVPTQRYVISSSCTSSQVWLQSYARSESDFC